MQQAILLAGFGVLDKTQRTACLDLLAAEIAAAFPGCIVRQAYTSAFIRRRLAAAGDPMDGLSEALQKLHQEGIRRVFVQPLHLTSGEEYEEKLVKPVLQLQADFADLQLGQPLLPACAEALQTFDFARLLQALTDEAAPKDGEVLVFMGHGSPHRHNPAYELLQTAADQLGLPLHIGVLEETDTPSLQDVLQRLQQHRIQKILLRPLLLTSGSHVTEDMAGPAPSSWKNQLEQAGFCVRVDPRGLASYPAFRQLYRQKIAHSLKECAMQKQD